MVGRKVHDFSRAAQPRERWSLAPEVLASDPAKSYMRRVLEYEGWGQRSTGFPVQLFLVDLLRGSAGGGEIRPDVERETCS